MTVAEYLSHAIHLSGKTQKQIADEAGFNKPNILSMMKQGLTKVPIYTVPALAKACGVDQVHFISLAMAEYNPEIWAVLQQVKGEYLSEDELRLLEEYRANRAQSEKA